MFVPKFATLVQVVEESIGRFAPRPFLGVKKEGRWDWMTYREFGDQVARLRSAFPDLDVQTGDRIAIISNNRPEWAIAAYAAYTGGAAFVPMYEAQLEKEWTYILQDSETKLLF